MSKAKVLRSSAEPSPELRPVLRPSGGNKAWNPTPKKKAPVKEDPKKIMRKPISQVPVPVKNMSMDGSCSSDSSCSLPSLKAVDFRRRRRQNGLKSVKIVPDGEEVSVLLPSPSLALTRRRCSWITANSDPLYVSFHDEEWGVPVHDERRLFELLTLSAALAELSWPTILSRRDTFRELFDNFDPASIAKFTEKKIISLKSNCSNLLSELKLQAVVDNARQILKVKEEFGSFSYYCWSFMNHKPVVNGFHYGRQVPVKTPKAEVISKDLMRRGFRCVGPTVIYSFMQAAGLVNDHLSSCFRYKECNHTNIKDAKIEDTTTLAEVLDNACSLPA